MLFRVHFIGVDSELSALFEKHGNIGNPLFENRSLLFPFSLKSGFFTENTLDQLRRVSWEQHFYVLVAVLVDFVDAVLFAEVCA